MTEAVKRGPFRGYTTDDGESRHGPRDYVLVPLSRGKFVKINPEDAIEVCKHRWAANLYGGHWYANRHDRTSGKDVTVLMHRQILGLTDKALVVDHINGDGLDNRRSNLRPATFSQNQGNRKPENNNSGFRGVHRYGRKYCAKIRRNGKQVELGRFDDPVEAAKAYDRAAIEVFGAFGRLNFTAARTLMGEKSNG